MEFDYELRIPKDRIAVLIGKEGETKKAIEASTKTKLDINSKEGDVTISGEDAIGLYTAREVVKAIGRGFNPDFALLLLKQDYALEMFNITDFAPNKNSIQRLKGRVIGAEGKSRKTIEVLTETHICIYGKTIGVIGEAENVSLARKAVESLLTGAKHANVYRWLEKKRKDMRTIELMGKDI
ncbi:pre-rRNA-processing protein PNO1 [Nanoarchaeota archaeon]